MISLVIRITFIFALLPTFIEARRHRRRFGLKLKKTDNSNDVVIKTQYDQCSQFCRPNPKQFVKIINEQWVISITTFSMFSYLWYFRFIDVGTCESRPEKSFFAFGIFFLPQAAAPKYNPNIYTCQPISWMNKKYWVGDKLNAIPVIAECGCRK